MGNKPNTTKCFFDIQIGSGQIQTIKFNLYTKDCPKTTNNFIQLCKGHKNYCFGGTNFHRCVKGFIIQGGDVTSGDGSGGISIYG